MDIVKEKGHRIVTKWFQPYMILESAKKHFDVTDYTFNGHNKFEMMDKFIEEINSSDKVKIGLYMKNVNKFYVLSLKTSETVSNDIDALENLLLDNKFGSKDVQVDENWIRITTDNDEPFNMIDLGKAEASFIMKLG